MSLYDLLVLGCRNRKDLRDFLSAVKALVDDSGIPVEDVQIITDAGSFASTLDRRKPTACACFRTPNATELAVVKRLLEARAPVVPIARTNERFEDFPKELQPLNGAKLPDDRDQWSTTAVAVLESAGLLRSQRRVFVSYRRDEAREPAIQLHDELSGRGFQVFLDTHAIRPGKVFQDQLWHSLCDSDVMVMLDTQTYFQRKWTRQEFGRAQSMGVNILRLVFPDHTPNPATQLTEKRELSDQDFDGEFLRNSVIDDVVEKVERLRARSIAARLLEMTGKLKTEVEAVGGSLEGTGAHRSVALKLDTGDRVWAYPIRAMSESGVRAV